jgi:hypothetical protein
LLIQKIGVLESKAVLGEQTYYRDVREMKTAGVSILEADENLIRVDNEFFNNFKMCIPSNFTINQVDDHRDSPNLLNLNNHKYRKGG